MVKSPVKQARFFFWKLLNYTKTHEKNIIPKQDRFS